MFTMIQQGGIFATFIAGLMIIAAVYFVLSVVNLSKNKPEDREKTAEYIANILRLGVFAAGTGFMATIWGGYLAITAILAAKDISMRIVYEGILCALSTTILGFQLFFVSGIVWFVLRYIQRKLS